MRLRYYHILFPGISILFLFSCGTLSTAGNDIKYIDPSEVDAAGFTFFIDSEKVNPGMTYEVKVVLLDSSNKEIPGIVSPEFFSVKSENNSFSIDKNNAAASTDVLNYIRDGYRLTVSIDNSVMPPLEKKFAFEIVSPENIVINSKRPVFEAAFYDISGITGNFNDIYILLNEKSTGRYFLAPPEPVDIYLGELTERVVVLYTIDSGLFNFLNFYQAQSISEQVKVAWDGLKMKSPLNNTELMFTEISAADFERNCLRNRF